MTDLSPIIMAEPVESVEQELALLEFQMALETVKHKPNVVLIIGEDFHGAVREFGRVLATSLATTCEAIESALLDCPLPSRFEEPNSVAELMRKELTKLSIGTAEYEFADSSIFPPSPRPPLPRTVGRPTGARYQTHHLHQKVLRCNRR